VLYALQAPATRRWAADRTYGVGRPRLGLKAIRSIPIPLPPLCEQRRIVELLDDHLSRLDAGSRAVELAATRADTFVAASATEALRAASGDVTTLGAVSHTVRNGIFVSRPGREPDGVPILRISAVRPLCLDTADIRYSGKPVPELSVAGSLLDEGDLLFTRYNGNVELVGACAVVPVCKTPLTYPDKLIRVVLDSRRAFPSYVALACTFGAGREQIRSRVKTTAGQAGVSGRELKAVQLVLPDVAEQARLAARFEDAVMTARRLQADLAAAFDRGQVLRRSVLTAAFSGRLSGRSTDGEVVQELAGV
jgi:type I restriction enzyme S subunit